MSVDMYRYDCLRSSRDLTSDLVDIHGPSPGVTVNQQWNASGIDHCQSARDDRKSRHDDFIARSQAESCHGHLQSRRAITNGHPMLPATISCPLLFKFFDEAPRRGDPTRAHTFAHILQLAITQ